jgi:hypothetical protein
MESLIGPGEFQQPLLITSPIIFVRFETECEPKYTSRKGWHRDVMTTYGSYAIERFGPATADDDSDGDKPREDGKMKFALVDEFPVIPPQHPSSLSLSKDGMREYVTLMYREYYLS